MVEKTLEKNFLYKTACLAEKTKGAG